jgi:hypothetical protein
MSNRSKYGKCHFNLCIKCTRNQVSTLNWMINCFVYFLFFSYDLIIRSLDQCSNFLKKTFMYPQFNTSMINSSKYVCFLTYLSRVLQKSRRNVVNVVKMVFIQKSKKNNPSLNDKRKRLNVPCSALLLPTLLVLRLLKYLSFELVEVSHVETKNGRTYQYPRSPSLPALLSLMPVWHRLQHSCLHSYTRG